MQAATDWRRGAFASFGFGHLKEDTFQTLPPSGFRPTILTPAGGLFCW